MYRNLSLIISLVLLLSGSLASGAHPNPVCWWKFDGDVLDSSGNEHHGTLMGNPAPVFVAGMFDQALDTTEANGPGYVGVPGFKGILGGNPFSITAWINTSDDTGTLIGWGSTPGGVTRFEFRPDADELRAESSGNVQGLTQLPDNEWIHVAVTVTANAVINDPDVLLYLNGQVDNDPSTGSNNSLQMAAGEHVAIARRHTSGRWFDALIDDLRIYDVELSQEEVLEAMRGIGPISAIATDPLPGDGASDIPYYVSELSWDPGDFSVKRNVYFSTNFEDVNTASAASLISEGQTGSRIDVGATELGATYYWRVDEVNGAPDHTVHAGDVWSFTVEPAGYPITVIAVTASGATPDMGPENTINGSGLNASGEHSTNANDMWLASGAEVWIQYEFDQVYNLSQILVWNSNQSIESFIGFGIKEALVETSTDGENWTPVEETTVFAQATSRDDYTANTVLAFNGLEAKYVRITGKSAYGLTGQMGLSEVQFTSLPLFPRELSPAMGVDTDGLDVTLSWRSGRFSTETQVLMDTDRAAVADGSAVIVTTTDKHVALSDLEYAQLHFWQVIDVAEDGTTYPSDLRFFYSAQHEAIEDFESYSGAEGAEIFMTWADAYGGDDTLGGSTAGYLQEPFVEVLISKSGKSMPLFFDNNGGFVNTNGQSSSPTFSAVTRDFAGSIDLTAGNADQLAVSFRGNGPSFAEDGRGNITMGGAGADIWGTSDQFRYAYRQLSGDGSLTVRVNSLIQTHNSAKAGPMIRASSDASSEYALNAVTPVAGIKFERRLEQSVAAVGTTETGLAPPYWVRIARTGNTFTAQRSADGVTWTSVGPDPAASSEEIVMPNDVLIGLAVTSHSSGNPTVAEFSDLSFSGSVSGAWTVEAIGVDMPSNEGQDPLYLMLEDSARRTATIPHPDPGAVQNPQWQEWEIPFDQLSGLQLERIKSVLLGVGYPDASQSGSEGVLYVDDLRVGASTMTAAVPGPVSPDGLIAHYEFEGDPADSTGQHPGTLFDHAAITPEGKIGQGLHLDVVPDVNGVDVGGYVAIDNLVYETTGLPEVTVAAWVRTSLESDQVLVSYDRSDYWRLQVNGEGGGPGQIGWSVYTSSGIVDYGSVARVDDGQWHHVAGIFDNGTLRLFIDGVPQPAATGGSTFGSGVRRFGYIGIGSESTEFNLEPRTPASYVVGDVDDVRIYHRALRPDEIAGLALGTGKK